MNTLNDSSLTCSTERYNTINLLRLNYKESTQYISDANRGELPVNKGYWLNQCKQDKRALKEHAEHLRARFARGLK